MEIISHGILLAFGLILPLGVQNVFIFTQGATQPSLIRALPATITAAICDSLLIVLSILGLSLIIMQVEVLRTVLMLAGVVFLFYMSITIWRSNSSPVNEGIAMPAKQQILFACSVSLLNPHALMDIVGVIGISALKYNGFELLLFTVSCIIVSWIWFFGLMFVGSRIKHFSNQAIIMQLFNKGSAIFIFVMAVYLAMGI